MKKYLELYWTFFKIGGLTFGGGLAMLPMLTREIVETHKWASEDELLDYFAISQCTPGVIAVNTATFIGQKLYGWAGAAWATVGVISPSVIIITIIAAVLSKFMTYPVVAHAFAGIRVAVCAMLIGVVLSLMRKTIHDAFGVIMFLAGLALCLFTPLPIAVIVVLAGTVGFFSSKFERSGK